MFALILNKVTKVIAKGRAVAVGGNNNAPIFTGDIKDSNISINQKSFDQAEFLSNSSTFDNCANKAPLLWATRQCLKMLSPSEEYKEN